MAAKIPTQEQRVPELQQAPKPRDPVSGRVVTTQLAVMISDNLPI